MRSAFRYDPQALKRSHGLGILTNIVAAEEDEYAAIGESLRPVDDGAASNAAASTRPRSPRCTAC
jgi:hypothetical protein